jgi:DNA-binding IclR family transcriptional regulator
MEKMNSQGRILLIIEKLAEHSVNGLSNRALAFELKTLEANICRDMKILHGRGWVEKTPEGKWRMSAKFGGFAGTIIKCFQTAKLRLTEDEARYASAMQ